MPDDKTAKQLRLLYPLTLRWRVAQWAKAVNQALFWWWPRG